jgi:hypothetical protein
LLQALDETVDANFVDQFERPLYPVVPEFHGVFDANRVAADFRY